MSDQCDTVYIRLRVRLYSRNCSIGPTEYSIKTTFFSIENK
jgi:hypothetical protein